MFSQFTSYLATIADELDRQGIAYYTITGATPKKTRIDLVNAFNVDDVPIFLISLKAGGTGLNLTGPRRSSTPTHGGTPPRPIRPPTARTASGKPSP